MPRKHNLKRKIRADLTREYLQELASKVRYGGNPNHKKNPGEFGLAQAGIPRLSKSLCDNAHVFTGPEAASLLKEGVRRGLISEQERNGWPQQIWSVTEESIPLEAMLENQESGSYHGYPLPPEDPMASYIVKVWHAYEK